MPINWNQVLGTSIDLLPPSALYYGLTGRSAGEEFTGSSSLNQGGAQQEKDDAAKALTFNRNILGDVQGYEAQKLKEQLAKEGRPIKNEAYDTLSKANKLASIYARQGMSEKAYDRATQNIERSASAALSGASSRGAGMNAIADIYGSTVGGFSDLAARDAEIARMNQGQYLQSFTPLAQAADSAEAYNELLPYEQKIAQMQSYLASSLQNKFGSLNFNYQDAAYDTNLENQTKGAIINAEGQIIGSAIGAAGSAIGG